MHYLHPVNIRILGIAGAVAFSLWALLFWRTYSIVQIAAVALMMLAVPTYCVIAKELCATLYETVRDLRPRDPLLWWVYSDLAPSVLTIIFGMGILVILAMLLVIVALAVFGNPELLFSVLESAAQE